MSVIEVERPAPSGPASHTFAERWDLGVRLVLLAVLLIGVVASLPSLVPQSRPLGQFLTDLRADRVTAVRHRSGSTDLVWSDGWSQWYHARVDNGFPQLGPSPDGQGPFVSSGDVNDVTYDWVRHALDVTGRNNLSDKVVFTGSSWTEAIPWHGLSLVVGLSTVSVFGLMLFNGGKRFGNRWAWFWVFASASFLGPLLYLLLEPSPAWPGRAFDRRYPDRPRFGGGAGFVIGLLLKGALSAGLLSSITWR